VDQTAHETIPASPGADDVWIPSVCRVCSNSCTVKFHRKNGVIVKIEGHPESPHNYGKICAKGMANIMTIYDPDRPRTPLVRTNPEKGLGVDPKWKEVTWDEALEMVAAERRPPQACYSPRYR
jgi:anaerobic selenocysteine-containing dehydrogenase